jgi:hypothetical protein
MKRLTLIAFAIVLLMCLTAFAQYTSDQQGMSQQTPATEKASAKAVTLSGKIGDDGKTFVSDKDNKSWTISNPEAVKGHEGHEVKLHAHEDTAKNELHVTSVKMKSEKKETMKKDETQK